MYNCVVIYVILIIINYIIITFFYIKQKYDVKIFMYVMDRSSKIFDKKELTILIRKKVLRNLLNKVMEIITHYFLNKNNGAELFYELNNGNAHELLFTMSNE